MLLDTAPQLTLELERPKTCCSCQPATKPARAFRYRPLSSKLLLRLSVGTPRWFAHPAGEFHPGAQ